MPNKQRSLEIQRAAQSALFPRLADVLTCQAAQDWSRFYPLLHDLAFQVHAATGCGRRTAYNALHREIADAQGAVRAQWGGRRFGAGRPLGSRSLKPPPIEEE